MKKQLNYVFVLLFALLAHNIVIGQGFEVTVPSTDDCLQFFEPIKAGSSFQFEINVKNNENYLRTVSIIKNEMGSVSSWVNIENNNLMLFPTVTGTFLLTVTIPEEADDVNHPIYLNFKAETSQGPKYFSYNTQKIIVDNSSPVDLGIDIGQVTSTSISVNSWSASDTRSWIYSEYQENAGVEGIEYYKIDIENPDGTIVNSITRNAGNDNPHTFEGLTPNTLYKVCLTAFDLAGHSKTIKEEVSTNPSTPVGLVFSNITYIGATLSWDSLEGATSYNVYQVIDDVNIKINSNPILGNSFNIVGLDPQITYRYNVIGISDVGMSDHSDTKPVTTLLLPKISGLPFICSETEDFSVANLLPGYMVTWSNNSRLSKQSSSGNSAVFEAIDDGPGWIGAHIIAPCGRVLELTKKHVWIGKPEVDIVGPEEVGPYKSITYTAQPYFNAYVNSYSWEISSPLYAYSYFSNTNQSYEIETKGKLGTFNLYLDASNMCGTKSFTKSIYVTNDGGGNVPRSASKSTVEISPNPANDYVNVKINSSDSDYQRQESNGNDNICYVKIYNSRLIAVYDEIIYDDDFTINTSRLTPGVYQLQIIYKDQKLNKSIIIQR